MMAQINSVKQKKQKVPVKLSNTEYYKKAFGLLATHALHQMIAQVPQVIFTMRFVRTGLLCRLIAVPQPGTATAKIIQAPLSLGPTPFVGLPAGRYTVAGAAAINGAAVAAWLRRVALVWDKHASIRLDKRYPALKKQTAVALDALADLQGLSQINYAGQKPVGQGGLGIQLVHIANASRHLQQILTWVKHPTGWAAAGSKWAKARWTIKPEALHISSLQFLEVIGKFPNKAKVSSPSILPEGPTLQNIFGSHRPCVYVAAMNHWIIFADARVAGKLPEVIRQIQKHQQNLPQLADIAEVAPFEPVHARLLFYLPLARWASLARQQGHPGAGRPVAGAVVIGAPVPPLLISESVAGGCIVYRAYMAYSLMSVLKSDSLLGGFLF
jgi:hypothetical protein